MHNVRKTFVASASELQSSDLYMTVKATLFTVPAPNLNGVRCTEAFLDEIVDHQDKYVGLPLCADVSNLVKGRYDKLGHCYDPNTGVFSSSIIGSFYEFEKVKREDGEISLVGCARILKRNKNVCHAISELFADNALKFSFEIACGAYTELEDGTIEIDASDKNFIEGMCVVSFPACPDAVATLLVAEIIETANQDENLDTDKDSEKEAATMPNKTAQETAEIVAEAAEVEVADKVETAETEVKETAEVNENTEVAENAEVKQTDETAEIVVHEHTVEVHDIDAYDTEDGSSVSEHLVHEIHTVTPIDNTIDTGYGKQDVVVVPLAEAENATDSTGPQETAVAAEHVEAEEVKTETAEDNTIAATIAELQASIEELKRELAELKNERNTDTIVAEVTKDVVAQVNPFVGDMKLSDKKYSLLEAPAKHEKYTLLD